MVASEWAHRVDKVIGIDASPDQIDRAKRITAPTSTVETSFLHAYSKNLPFEDNSVDCIYTVEALQHFESPLAFVEGSARCLKPGGRLVVSTFLAERALTPKEHDEIASQVRTVAIGIDKLVPVDQLEGMMRDAGLCVRRRSALGHRVWGAFAAWCAQVQPSHAWPAVWKRAYMAGLVDYFVIVADKLP